MARPYKEMQAPWSIIRSTFVIIGVSCEMVAFVELNPSCKDESINDPAIRRCIKFAKELGCEGMHILNAYTFRATEPRDMKTARDPVGPKK